MLVNSKKSFFKHFNKKISAFTLAEVLITLGIIGIVAALTIPTLMQKTQDQEYKTAYKKAYSEASQAWTKAMSEDLISPRPGWGDGATRVSNFQGFMSEFKVIKKCFSNNNADCWNSGGDKYFTTLPNADAPAFVDASGMAWSINANALNNGSGAEILVDTNGDKKPNQFGLDRFVLKPLTVDAKNDNNVGMPVKILPVIDITSAADDTNAASICPSFAKHPCYFTSWLTGNK